MTIPSTTVVYGNVTPQQSKSRVISKVQKISGFKYPIDVTPLRGYFTKQSGDQLVRTMLKTLIRTQRGERFMLPDYGMNLKKFLFEPLDGTTFNLIKKEIGESINKYLRRVKINKLQVFENKTSFGDGKALSVQLFCRLRGEDDVNFDVNVKI